MLFYPDIMMVISISTAHTMSKRFRMNPDKGQQKRFLYYYNYNGKFKRRTIGFIQSVYLKFYTTHSKLIPCEKCGIKQRVRYRKKKDLDNWKCKQCLIHG